MRRRYVLLLLGLLVIGACTARAGMRPLAAAPPAAVRGVPATAASPTGPAAQPNPALSGRIEAHVPRQSTTVGVVVLHSFNHTADEPRSQGWSAAADRYGFVAIYPSRGDDWNAGLCCGDAAADKRDDVAWLVSVIADARLRYGLREVYLAGFSNGGMMAERLVAEHPEVAERMVTWGSAPEMPKAGTWPGVSVLYTGEYDRTVPAAGATRTIGGRATTIRAGATTGWWLLGGSMTWLIVPGHGDEPPEDWPDLAWRALSSPPGSAPRG